MATEKTYTQFEVGDLVRLKGMADCPPHLVTQTQADIANQYPGGANSIWVTRFNPVTGKIDGFQTTANCWELVPK